MSRRLCIVSCRDAEGAEHSVEVCARTIFEAAILGLRSFRAAGVDQSTVERWSVQGALSVQFDGKRHEVGPRQIEEWFACVGRSPREQALRMRLRTAIEDAPNLHRVATYTER